MRGVAIQTWCQYERIKQGRTSERCYHRPRFWLRRLTRRVVSWIFRMHSQLPQAWGIPVVSGGTGTLLQISAAVVVLIVLTP